MAIALATALAVPLLANLVRDPSAPDAASAWAPADADFVANERAARELMALAHGDASPAEIAKAAGSLQLRLNGFTPVEPTLVRHGLPSLAAAELLARHGAVPTLDQRVSIAALDLLVPETRDALTLVLDAYLAFDDANRRAFASVDAERVAPFATHAPPGVLSARDAGLDPAPVVAARGVLLDAGAALRDALERHPARSDGPVAVAPVLALDLDGVDNVWVDDYALQVDAGGNDVYLNNAGGNHFLPLPNFCVFVIQGAAALLDFDGDDQFASGRSCGVNGGGNGGSGFLWDMGGDDLYRAGSDGTDGGALVGTGFLLDESGSDVHDVTGWGTTGGGFPAGIGFLMDLGDGSDAYTTWWEATNGGGSLGGAGFLYEEGGDDVYVAQWGGTNGGSEGGRGFLVDAAGDDSYTAEWSGVNGGGFLGPGFLWDDAGTDQYVDEEGGSGTDVTVVPKVVAGAQVDN